MTTTVELAAITGVTQLVRSTPATLEIKVYRGDTAVDLDANPTVAVVDAQGTAVTSGTVAKTAGATGAYTATVAAPAYLTTLTATWSGLASSAAVTITQAYEVVGGYLFTLADLRAYKSGLSSTDQKLVDARDQTTDMFESWCGQSFIPRPGYIRVSGDGSTLLNVRKSLVTSVVAVEEDGTEIDLTNVDVLDGGLIYNPTGWTFGVDNLEVWFEHGHTFPPRDIQRAAIKYAAYEVLADTSSISPRAMGLTNEFGNIRYAGFAPTGLPDVDAVLARYRIPPVA
jgi:hypothetical protein